MAFHGFEADRNTLKYRCPAAAYDLHCAGRQVCLARSGSKAGDYGRIVRIGLDEANRRIFTPTPWGSPSMEWTPPLLCFIIVRQVPEDGRFDQKH